MGTSLGRWLLFVGLALAAVGLVLMGLGRFVRLGHLPLDFRFERGRAGFYFPLGTAILLSIVLTVLLNVVVRLLRR